jgi:RimJ/RimL family protein N-acetyltransferase
VTDQTPEDVHLGGRRVRLRPILQRDYEMLLQIELSEQLGPYWRLRGRTPAPDSYSQTLWGGVLAQFLVVRRDTEQVLGMVTVYNADVMDGHASFSAAKFLRADRSTLILQGSILMLDYAFAHFPLRKIYLEVNEYNLPQFSSGIGRILKPEGILHAHTFSAGRYWDKHIFAIYRDEWNQRAPDFRRLVLGRDLTAQQGNDDEA